MASQQSAEDRDPVVVEIERVLAAERTAEQRLQDCRREADALVAAARVQAAAINRRAETRISRLHTAYLDKVSAEVAVIAKPAAGSEAAEPLLDRTKLVEAAQRLAAKLTGAA